MKHSIRIVLMMLLLLIPGMLCAQGSGEVSGSISAVDSFGNLVTLDEYPERIVIAGKASLLPADALFLFPEARSKVVGLGLTNQGLGDFYTYLAPQFTKGDRLPHSVGAEEIASLAPDVVITKSRNYASLGKQLEMLGIPVFSMDLENPETFTEELLQLSILLGEEQRGTELAAYYADELASVQASVSGTRKPSSLLLYCTASDGITSFQTAPKEWLQTYMTEAAGGSAVWKGTNLTSGWQKVSFEQVAAWDPERIYLISYKVPTSVFLQQIEEDPAWSHLQAVKNGSIQAFPADFHNWAQPDTRWILGLKWLARDLHGSVDGFEEEVSTFFTELYGIGDPSVIAELTARYEDSLQ